MKNMLNLIRNEGKQVRFLRRHAAVIRFIIFLPKPHSGTGHWETEKAGNARSAERPELLKPVILRVPMYRISKTKYCY